MTTILAEPDGGLPTTASVLWLAAYLTVAVAAVGSAELRRRAVLGAALRDELTGRGLLLRAEQRAAVTRWRTWLLVLVGVGVAGLVPAGIVGGSVGYLVLVLVALSGAAWWWGRRTVPFRPAVGNQALARHRTEHEASSRRWEPDRATTGPAAATEVGLFGVGALWVADPAFAGQVLPTGTPGSTDVTGAGLWNVPSHGGDIEYYRDRIPMLLAGGGG